MSDIDIPRLTAANRAVLAAVLDELLPASTDGKLPSASDIGLVEHVERALGQIPAVAPVIAEGLAKVVQSGDFAAAPSGQRTQLVKRIESEDATFLLTLMFIAYSGYYQNERVIAGLGLEPRPPHPRGYAMEPNDLSLLDGVRRRPTMYREV